MSGQTQPGQDPQLPNGLGRFRIPGCESCSLLQLCWAGVTESQLQNVLQHSGSAWSQNQAPNTFSLHESILPPSWHQDVAVGSRGCHSLPAHTEHGWGHHPLLFHPSFWELSPPTLPLCQDNSASYNHKTQQRACFGDKYSLKVKGISRGEGRISQKGYFLNLLVPMKITN